MKSSFDFLKSKITRDSAAEMGWVIAGHLTSVILSFVIIKILSGMGTEEYGIYVLVFTVAAFLGIVYGPLQQAFIRFYYDYLNKNLVTQYLNFVFSYLIRVSSFFLALIIISGFFFIFFIEFSEPLYFYFLAGIYIIIFKINEFFNSALNVIRRRKENSILQGLEKIIVILLLFIFISVNKLNLTNVFFTLNIAAVIFLSIKILIFNKYSGKSEDAPGDIVSIKQNFVMYITPFLIWAVAGWLQLNGEKWIINGILSTSDVGIYALMMNVVTALLSLPYGIVAEFITPIIFKNYSDLSNKENIKTGLNYINITIAIISALTIFSTIITYYFGEELILIISSKNYTSYSYLLPLLCLGTGLFLTAQAQILLGMALNQPQKYVACKVTTGILSVLLNLILINYFGIKGVAYTILIAGIFYIVYVYIVNKNLKKAVRNS